MAAEDAIAALERELQCSICQESYDDPRLLSCLHFFCRKCVQKLLLTSDRRTCLRCPLCRRESHLPHGQVENLRKNVFAGRMVDIIGAIDSEKVRSKQHRCQGEGCTAESNYGTAVFYCESCQVAVCGSCGMKHHRDARQHNIMDINEAVKEKRGQLLDLLQWGKIHAAQLIENRNLFVTHQQEIIRLFEAIKTEISAATLEKIQCLKQQEKRMKETIGILQSDIKGKVDRELASNVEVSIAHLHSLNISSETLINQSGNASILTNYRKTCEDYARSMRGAKGDNSSKFFSRIAAFTEAIRFEKSEESSTLQTGRILNVKDWLVEQFRWPKHHPEFQPSGVVTLPDGTLAVGNIKARTIEFYDLHGQHQGTAEDISVKDMASLPNGSLLVLNNDGVLNLLSKDKTDKFAVTRDCCLSDDKPAAIATDVKGNRIMAYKHNLLYRSEDGSLLCRIPFELSHEPSELHVREFKGRPKTAVLLRTGTMLRLFDVNLDSGCIAQEVNLPHDHPSAERFGFLDNDGSIYIAYLRDRMFITIMKYHDDSFTYCEVIITDLQVVLEPEESIFLTGLGPHCFVMCTPHKLSVFTKDKVKDVPYV